MGEDARKPVPGGLSTGIGRAAVADPAANPWGALIVAVPGSRAEGVEALAWFADPNAMVSTLAMEIPLWNVDPSSEDDTHRAQQVASLGARIVAGGGTGSETFSYTVPAVKHLLQMDADIRWMGNLDDLLTSDEEVPVSLRGEFRPGDGATPIGDADKDAFVQFLRERSA